MNMGDRVRIISGPGAGHEGNVISVHAGYVKGAHIGLRRWRSVARHHESDSLRPAGASVCAIPGPRVQAPVPPPKPVIRDGALDFKACPSHYGEWAQS